MTEPYITVVVGARCVEAEGIVSLTLHRPDGGDLPAWEPGAHIDVMLVDGPERQYSLCGNPSDRHAWHIAVLREPGGRGGSLRIHDELSPGTSLRVRGPRNHFALRPAAHYRFVAGGIGITPILPMLAAAEAAGADWTLLYGGRTLASMAFRDQLARRYGNRVLLRPQGESGLLDLAGYLGTPEPDTLVYCCGPGPLLDAVERHCANAGWPQPRTERFQPKPPAPALPTPPSNSSSREPG